MFISVTVQAGSESRDIRIDSEQRLVDSLAVLRQSGKLPDGSIPDYFRSRLKERLVSAYRTFADEQVHDGDVLTAII
jgi:uncharacterized ubiquitin-like protein YukD